MRHRAEGKKFNRKTGPRRSFLRNLACDFIRHGRIETTEARAKVLRPTVERLITIAKRNTLASRRLVMTRLGNEAVANRLIHDVAPRYQERPGGYLRVTKLPDRRKRDAGKVARLELV